MVNVHLYPSSFRNEARILRIADSLARVGLFDQIDLVGVGGQDLPQEERIDSSVRIVRLAVSGARSNPLTKTLFMTSWSLAAFRRYAKAPVSCINCHSLSTLPLGVMLKKATGAKLVYDTHELETETNGLTGLRKAISKIVERLLIGYADHSIFVGRLIRDWYCDRYSLTKTDVIFNCPRTHDVLESDNFRDRFGIANDIPIFLYQGVLAKGRGLLPTVDAFRDLVGTAALVVMGYGPLEGWLKSIAETQENIFFHPAVPPGELATFTMAADYGVSIIESTALSYEYCMPNKLFEYVMARRPVLVSPTREQSEFVEKNGVGVVLGEISPEAIKKGALELIEKGRHSFQHALDATARNYNWENQELTLRRIYDELLSGDIESEVKLKGSGS